MAAFDEIWLARRPIQLTGIFVILSISLVIAISLGSSIYIFLGGLLALLFCLSLEWGDAIIARKVRRRAKSG